MLKGTFENDNKAMTDFFKLLPEIYQSYWMLPRSTQFAKLNPIERFATCSNCICSQNKYKWLPSYRSELKCCTFYPFMPNYLIGEILNYNGPNKETHKKKVLIQSLIEEKNFTLPMGVFAPVSYQKKFINREPQDFGNQENLLCPYYSKEANSCGIWQFRGSVCSTYFCASDHREQGMVFWEAMGDYLHSLEMIFSQDIIARLGFSEELIEMQLEYINAESGSQQEEDGLDPGLFKYLWNGYQTHEILDFYKTCASMVRQLNQDELIQLTQEHLGPMEETLVSLYLDAGFELEK